MSYSDTNTPGLTDLEEGATTAAKAKMKRHQSAITIFGIDANHPALVDQDPAVQEMALKIIDELDLDKDGKLDSNEVLKGIVKAAETNYSVKQLLRKHNFIFGLLACVIVLLCLSTFGTSIAAALLTKETTVSANGNMKVYGSDETVKTVPTGRRSEALAPVTANQDLGVEAETKSFGCLSAEDADLLKLESFFTPTVLASPDGAQHSIQAHDIESTEDGGFILTDMTGTMYSVEKSSDCQAGVVDRHGRQLQILMSFTRVSTSPFNIAMLGLKKLYPHVSPQYP